MSDLEALLTTQRAAFADEMPVGVAVRRNRLRRLRALVVDNAAAFCDAMAVDFGHRSRDQSMLTDIAASTASLDHALRNLKRWMRPERRRPLFPLGLLGASARVEYQPKGVVGVIAPWNFPVNLVVAPLAGILAAGNRAMVKTSEYTPATGACFAEHAPRYFDADELAFTGGGAEVGARFAALPFDHLLFTGGGATGRAVLRATAANLVPVTLELGGKSPVVVGRGADLSRVAERVVAGKMLNAGQICLAPDYMLVPAEEEEAMVAALADAASRLYPMPRTNPDYAAIIDDRHLARLNAMVDDARAKGASVQVIDGDDDGPQRPDERRLPLHLLRGVGEAMTCMEEEIFGPLLPILPYRDIDEAIEAVNARPSPLALYHFGPERAERRRLLDRTRSGGVTLDDVIFHVAQETLPFGGVGASGMGAYHGETGFRTFSHARAIYRQSPLDVAALAGIKPPYGARMRRAIAARLRG